MMGIKVYQEKMFYNFSLSERVSQDHFLRKVVKVLDLSFVRKLMKPYYSYTGQPSIDPLVKFLMMLIGYFYGITSERRLAEEISLNMAFMWYLGYDLDEFTPNHLDKVRMHQEITIQALLTSTVQNIKRLVKHCYTPITNSVSFVLEQFRFSIRKPHLQTPNFQKCMS